MLASASSHYPWRVLCPVRLSAPFDIGRDSRCPDDLSAGNHAFRHNGDDAVFCPLPSQMEESSDSCAPEPGGNGLAGESVVTKMPAGVFEHVASASPLTSNGERKVEACSGEVMDMEFQDDLFFDMFPGEGIPQDECNLMPLEEDAMSAELLQLNTSPGHGMHRGQLVKFDVQRGEQLHREQPLRHTSSGAASRHRAPQPLNMQRSHSNAELMGMGNCKPAEISRSTLRKSLSDSKLVDRANGSNLLQTAHAKRSRR